MLHCFTIAETLLNHYPERLSFNCSSVDGHLSSSANFNSLTTMAVRQPEMFDFRQATVFFVWDATSQITKLPVVQEAIAPFGYAYALQSFKFLQRTFTMRKLFLCFILKRKKQIIWNRQNFLKKNARKKKNTVFFFLSKEFVLVLLHFFPFSEKNNFCAVKLANSEKTTHFIPHVEETVCTICTPSK